MIQYKSHITHSLETYFQNYWEFFPSSYDTKNIKNYLKGMTRNLKPVISNILGAKKSLTTVRLLGSLNLYLPFHICCQILNKLKKNFSLWVHYKLINYLGENL